MKSSEKDEGFTEVYAWGSDRYGQLGIDGKQGARNYCIPKLCTFNVVIRKVACGEEHSAFITSNGNIFTMGSNADGRLGIGDRKTKLSLTPCLVEALSKRNAKSISCGWGHTAVVIDNGDLYTWGVGEYGALGISNPESQWEPVKVNFSVKDDVIVVGASCGTRHTAIVDQTGRVYVFGSGDAGQLGNGSRNKEIIPCHVTSLKERTTQVACGVFHTLVLSVSGIVYAMGGNNFGQLGIGSKKSSAFPIAVKGLENEKIVKIAAGHFSAALNEKGRAYIWGTGVFGECILPTPLTGVKATIKDIEVGGSFGAVIDSKGLIYSWGSNSSGELGQGDYEARAQAAQIPSLIDKSVFQVSCGGSFVIALGKKVPYKYQGATRTPTKQSNRATNIGKEEEKQPIKSAEQKKGRESYSIKKSIASEALESEHRPKASQYKYKESLNEPITEDPQSDLLEIYKAEQEKGKALMKEIEEKKQRNRILKERTRKDNLKKDPSQTYLRRLAEEEKQLATEQQKSRELIRKLESEVDREQTLQKQAEECNNKVKELETKIAEMKKENARIRNEKLEYTSGENKKLSELLKDFEEKIEREVEEKHKIMKDKTAEIHQLHDQINKLENDITSIQHEKTDLSNYYKEELLKHEQAMEDHKSILNNKLSEKEAQIQIQKKDEDKIFEIKGEIKKLEKEIEDLTEELKNASGEIEKKKREVSERDKEISALYQRKNEFSAELQAKNQEFAEKIGQNKNKELSENKAVEDLRIVLQEKMENNEELQSKISVKQQEISSLNKDVNAWNEVANNVKNENTQLKNTIESLEQKNKKLLEAINLHLYNRAAEYKERTIKALKKSRSPFKDQIPSEECRKYVSPSPERLQKFLEEEKKGPTVFQISQLKPDIAQKSAIEAAVQQTKLSPSFERQKEEDKEESKYVKSNYTLVKMLDEYKNPTSPPREIPKASPIKKEEKTPKREERSIDERHQEIVRSTQELLRVLGASTVHTGAYATPKNLKGKEKVYSKDLIINRAQEKSLNIMSLHQQQRHNVEI